MRKAAAHPRLRGADAGIWIAAGAFCGSSPLTRGGRVTSINHKCVRRLIPAYAGRTLGSVNAAAGCGAHPRLRGADRRRRWCLSLLHGSSPLTRGGLRPIQSVPSMSGLIPAYAGRTQAVETAVDCSWAHPRLRGADVAFGHDCQDKPGSSPLTRGGLSSPTTPRCGGGLIPAYAGRTQKNRAPAKCDRAHPRLRGADPAGWGCESCLHGSSPLTRGGQLIGFLNSVMLRLIPAYAGRTASSSRSMRTGRAHPRLRGADCSHDAPPGCLEGSSPLTRGGRIAN